MKTHKQIAYDILFKIYYIKSFVIPYLFITSTPENCIMQKTNTENSINISSMLA